MHSWVQSGMHEKQVTCGHLSDGDKAVEYSESYPGKEIILNALKKGHSEKKKCTGERD